MFIKRPIGTRRTYALIGNDGKTVYDPRIDQLNLDLKRGIAVDELEGRAKKIKESFKPTLTLSHTNLRLAEEVMAEKLIKWEGEVIHPKVAYRALIRAAEWLGPHLLSTMSYDDLKKLFSRPMSKGTKYHLKRSVNAMLRHIGHKTLPNPQPKLGEPAHISVKDFLTLLPQINVRYQSLLAALFGTGCRWGEMPLAQLRQDTEVYVSQQIRHDRAIGAPKSKEARRSPIIPSLQSLTLQYISLPLLERKQLRYDHKKVSKDFKRVYSLRIHDLRHSYAIAWLNNDVSSEKIARFIGNDPEVCRKHYLAHCPTNDEIKTALAKWRG